jgi:nucleotide-binding universal stress UspA family protein
MDQPESPIHMVVAYDFSDTAQVSLERGIALAQAEPDHIMHIIAVLDERGSLGILKKKGKVTYDDTVVIQETLEGYINTQLETVVKDAELRFFVHVRLGSPAEEILRLGEEVGAHIILVGSHGRTGLKRVFMGSVSEKVVREAKCPVLVVRPREYEDVNLAVVVDAPEGHAEENPYVRPTLYAYRDRQLQKHSSPWEFYNR